MNYSKLESQFKMVISFRLDKFQKISLTCDAHLLSEGNLTTGYDTIDFLTEVISARNPDMFMMRLK